MVLAQTEGHFTRGFGDGSTPVQGSEPIDALAEAVTEAEHVVRTAPG